MSCVTLLNGPSSHATEANMIYLSSGSHIRVYTTYVRTRLKKLDYSHSVFKSHAELLKKVKF